jgi:hypothetical protein
VPVLNKSNFQDLSDREVRYLLSRINVTLTCADENYVGLSGHESLSGTPVIYLGIPCWPSKYCLRIRINRNIIPHAIGYKLPQEVNEISKFLLKLDQAKCPAENDIDSIS